jgi:hypothetical protein
MCDGCPDITVHEGKLVWSCRLDELKQFGCFTTAAPKAACGQRVERVSQIRKTAAGAEQEEQPPARTAAKG